MLSSTLWILHGTYTPSKLLLFPYYAWIVLKNKVCMLCLKVDVMISTKSRHRTKLDIRVYNVYISEILYTVIQLRIRIWTVYWHVPFTITTKNAEKNHMDCKLFHRASKRGKIQLRFYQWMDVYYVKITCVLCAVGIWVCPWVCHTLVLQQMFFDEYDIIQWYKSMSFGHIFHSRVKTFKYI